MLGVDCFFSSLRLDRAVPGSLYHWNTGVEVDVQGYMQEGILKDNTQLS